MRVSFLLLSRVGSEHDFKRTASGTSILKSHALNIIVLHQQLWQLLP
jgi:hypothetical protein